MSRTLRCAAVTVVLTLLPTSMLLPAAGAEVPARPSRRFCTAFTDYYAVQFLIAIAGGFAEIGDEESTDAGEVEATLMLALSPKLAEITAAMRSAAPRILRRDIAAQVRLFREGVALLEEIGVPKRVIRRIADTTVDDQPDPTDDLPQRLRVSEARLLAAGKRFARIADPVLDSEVSSPKVAAAIELAANECGIFPDTRIACDELLTDEQAAAILGEPATDTDDEGCAWETAANADGDTGKVAVDVYATTTPYERFLEENKLVEQVPALGDAAVAIDGFSTVTSISSCGRTVAARVGARTVQVALCDRDDEVTTEGVAAVARQVVAAL